MDTFRERMAQADTAPVLNAALAASLAGLWASVEDGRLRVEFKLVADRERLDYLADHAKRAGSDGEQGHRAG